MALLLILVASVAFPATASLAATAALGKQLRPPLAAASVCVEPPPQDDGGGICKSERAALLCLQSPGVMGCAGVFAVPARATPPRLPGDVPARSGIAYDLDPPPRA